MRQRLAAELLDDDLGSPAEIAHSLDDLWWLNRRFGGVSGLRRLLARLPRRDHWRLLDAGAGRGEMTAFAAAALSAHGARVTAIALDRRASHLGPARPALVADALRLPLRDGAVDVVVCNLMLHHFHGPAALGLLRSLGRVAAQAVVVCDLERAWLPWLFTRWILPLAVSRITRYDAPRSVRQAYTARELEALARAAGFARFEVSRLPGWRLGLIIWTAGRNAAL